LIGFSERFAKEIVRTADSAAGPDAGAGGDDPPVKSKAKKR
jgi:hypothetical protein